MICNSIILVSFIDDVAQIDQAMCDERSVVVWPRRDVPYLGG
jgi:hypothetical protein